MEYGILEKDYIHNDFIEFINDIFRHKDPLSYNVNNGSIDSRSYKFSEGMFSHNYS